jgi:limonene-1,2-epoxide hydrolase
MTKEKARELIEIYGRAWVTQDPELVLTIFTPDTTYFDPKEGEKVGHARIKAYWQNKVVESQKDISFKLLNIWLDGETVISEWHAVFTDTKLKLIIDMTEVGIFEVEGDKFKSLREYYRTTKKPLQ